MNVHLIAQLCSHCDKRETRPDRLDNSGLKSYGFRPYPVRRPSWRCMRGMVVKPHRPPRTERLENRRTTSEKRLRNRVREHAARLRDGDDPVEFWSEFCEGILAGATGPATAGRCESDEKSASSFRASRLNILFLSLRAPVLLLDADFAVEVMNPAACELTGASGMEAWCRGDHAPAPLSEIAPWLEGALEAGGLGEDGVDACRLDVPVVQRHGERHFNVAVSLTADFSDSRTGYAVVLDDITKLPVRAAGLAHLSVAPDSTVWDLGAGCGSVSIEASHLARRGRVFAVERNKTRAAMIRENIRRTGAWLVDVVLGEMPEALDGLPEPDRIFIGGGLGGEANQDSVLLDIACRKLAPRGRMVVHCILLDSLHTAKDHFQSLGWHFGVTQLQASATDSLAGDLRFKAQNPVFVLWAEKP